MTFRRLTDCPQSIVTIPPSSTASEKEELLAESSNLLNISEFVYFICGLSPPKKRRVVR